MTHQTFNGFAITPTLQGFWQPVADREWEQKEIWKHCYPRTVARSDKVKVLRATNKIFPSLCLTLALACRLQKALIRGRLI